MKHPIQVEIDRRWRRVRKRLPVQNAKRVPIETFAAQVTTNETRNSSTLLQPWLYLFDEAFGVLYLLFHFTHAQHQKVKPPDASFLLLLGRALNLVAASRHLLVAGFDQASRPLVRALVENLDVAAVALHDPSFAATFVAADEEDEASRRFWRENVAYGKVHARVETIAQTIGLDEPGQKWFTRHRAEANDRLSPAVHSSLTAARLSTFVPSLESLGMFLLEPLGHISAHTPMTLDFVTKDVQLFSVLILQMLMSDPPPEIFRSVDVSSVLFQSLAAEIMLLQSIVSAHADDIEKFRQSVRGCKNFEPAEPGA